MDVLHNIFFLDVKNTHLHITSFGHLHAFVAYFDYFHQKKNTVIRDRRDIS